MKIDIFNVNCIKCSWSTLSDSDENEFSGFPIFKDNNLKPALTWKLGIELCYLTQKIISFNSLKCVPEKKILFCRNISNYVIR